MPADLFSTAANVWALVAVAGAGIAALPWSDREVRATARSIAAVPAVVGGWLPIAARAARGADQGRLTLEPPLPRSSASEARFPSPAWPRRPSLPAWG